MNSRDALRRMALALCIAVCAALRPAPALAVAPGDVLLVEQNTHRLHRADGQVSRVAVGNPEIADVTVINRRELLITGKSKGITSLIVWVKGLNTPHEYRIRVGDVRDPTQIQTPDPDLAKAAIDEGHGLGGTVPDVLAHRRATLAAQPQAEGSIKDRSQVQLETQVMTSVKIAEVGRSTLQRYGLFAGRAAASGRAGGVFSPGSLSGVELNQNGNSGLNFLQNLPIQNAFNLVFSKPANGVLGVLSLLENKGLVRVLAEPSLVAMSGQTATYLAGGEFPVPVSQGGSTSGGISVEYKEFGVRLSLSPTVLSRERIALKVAPEVSDLDFSAGIQVGGVAVPALTVRRTETSIELGDGESFVISGLVSSNLTNNVDKVPWLGDVPVIGALFRSNNMQRSDRELIMIVTPHLVRPIARGAQLPPLPGARYDHYRPSAAQTIFLENGDFESGFSN